MREEQPSATTPGLALRRHPIGLLFTSWPWRSLAHLLSTPVIAVVWLVSCWPLLALAGVPLGHVERHRLRLLDRGAIPNPHAPASHAGLREWIRARSRERITWTELLHGVLLVPLSALNFVVLTLVLLMPGMLTASSGLLVTFSILGIDPATVDPNTTEIQRNPIAQALLCLLGLALIAAGLYAVTLVAEGQRYLARPLITEPTAELTAQLDDLTRSRARVTSAFDAERRRIERDLHDGVQQRLTALMMTLGSMRYQHDRRNDITHLIEQAGTDVRRAVEELREIVHDIFPAALREKDLTGALDDLAARTETAGISTEVSIDLPENIPGEAQVGVYFAASELCTNILKHARATRVLLLAHHADGRIFITVEDDGAGGADPSGTGLLGVIDRIETLGGNVRLTSPIGGPTRITLEVPCAS
ncbi:sensor domain-containing protein [Micromonospora sp. NPDC023956]|uniref:sensor histidine kinase n=1 Tax=Micromonospora sp. NPDC023956 TaxID=3155722 RepID=UPI0033CD0867